MTLLSTLYASAPAAEVLIPTLEISHPSFAEPIRTCAGFEDHAVTLEGVPQYSGHGTAAHLHGTIGPCYALAAGQQRPM